MNEYQNKNLFKGICVYVEQRRGLLQESSLQLLYEARKLAAKLRTNVITMSVGHQIESLAPELIYYGADIVIYVDHEQYKFHNPEVYANVLASLLTKYKPEIVLVAGTKYGRELTPTVAAKLETGVTADCTSFDIDENSNLQQIRPPFGGRVLANIITPEHRPQMATARPNIFPTPEKNLSRKGKIIREEVTVPNPKLKIVKFEESKDTELQVEKADVIVSRGRGFNKADSHLLNDLCSFFGNSSIGCSRPVVDAGIMPKRRQVGQTGKSVRPKLYIAIGISGAVQHIAGMKDSEYVLAINQDPNASIFKFSDFGIIGDYRKVLPKLLEKLNDNRARVLLKVPQVHT